MAGMRILGCNIDSAALLALEVPASEGLYSHEAKVPLCPWWAECQAAKRQQEGGSALCLSEVLVELLAQEKEQVRIFSSIPKTFSVWPLCKKGSCLPLHRALGCCGRQNGNWGLGGNAKDPRNWVRNKNDSTQLQQYTYICLFEKMKKTGKKKKNPQTQQSNREWWLWHIANKIFQVLQGGVYVYMIFSHLPPVLRGCCPPQPCHCWCQGLQPEIFSGGPSHLLYPGEATPGVLCAVWVPQYKTDMGMPERVQQRATKVVRIWRKGWKSWDCLAWRRGESYQCIKISEGRV